jgi:hypothetical protein
MIYEFVWVHYAQLNLSMEGLIAVVTVAQEGSLERAGQVLGLGTRWLFRPMGDRWSLEHTITPFECGSSRVPTPLEFSRATPLLYEV